MMMNMFGVQNQLGSECSECGNHSLDLCKCPCGLAFYCGTACQEAHWPIHREECTAAYKGQKALSSCIACGATGMHLKSCLCGSALYCDTKCQQAHWGSHRRMCSSWLRTTRDKKKRQKHIEVQTEETSQDRLKEEQDKITEGNKEREEQRRLEREKRRESVLLNKSKKRRSRSAQSSRSKATTGNSSSTGENSAPTPSDKAAPDGQESSLISSDSNGHSRSKSVTFGPTSPPLPPSAVLPAGRKSNLKHKPKSSESPNSTPDAGNSGSLSSLLPPGPPPVPKPRPQFVTGAEGGNTNILDLPAPLGETSANKDDVKESLPLETQSSAGLMLPPPPGPVSTTARALTGDSGDNPRILSAGGLQIEKSSGHLEPGGNTPTCESPLSIRTDPGSTHSPQSQLAALSGSSNNQAKIRGETNPLASSGQQPTLDPETASESSNSRVTIPDLVSTNNSSSGKQDGELPTSTSTSDESPAVEAQLQAAKSPKNDSEQIELSAFEKIQARRAAANKTSVLHPSAAAARPPPAPPVALPPKPSLVKEEVKYTSASTTGEIATEEKKSRLKLIVGWTSWMAKLWSTPEGKKVRAASGSRQPQQTTPQRSGSRSQEESGSPRVISSLSGSAFGSPKRVGIGGLTPGKKIKNIV